MTSFGIKFFANATEAEDLELTPSLERRSPKPTTSVPVTREKKETDARGCHVEMKLETAEMSGLETEELHQKLGEKQAPDSPSEGTEAV